jgi:heme exporter protein D
VNWGSLDNFLTMGGYGFYVWGAYGMAAAILVIELWQLKARRRRALAELKREVARRSAA